MTIQGLRLTTNFATDERPKNWREGILLRWPNGKAPLTALTSAMKTRVVDDAEFNWWEKELSNRSVALSATITAIQTTIAVSSGAYQLKAGDLLWSVQSSEIMRVSADPSSDTSIPVTRGFANTTAAAITYNATLVNPNLVVLAAAFEENSDAPTGINFDPTKIYNYTQIIRHTLEASRTALKTRLRTGDQAKEAKREVLELHSMDMERAFWFGKRNETTISGKPVRTTMGVLEYLNAYASSNVIDAVAATVNYEYIETQLEAMFRFGSSEKMAFCGNTFLLNLQRTIRKARGGQLQIIQGQKEFGMNIQRLVCPFGELVFKTHPLFNNMLGGTNAGSLTFHGPSSWCFVLDMENVQYVHLKDSDTKYQADLQANGVDGMKSGYLTECALELHHAKTHFLIKNLVSSSVES